MKKFYSILSFLLFCIVTNAQTKFTMETIQLQPNEAAVLEVTLSNTEVIDGFQFDLSLPAGISVTGTGKKQQAKLVGRLEDMEYTTGKTTAGDWGIRVYSTEGVQIAAGNDVVLQINIKADAEATAGSYKARIINVHYTTNGTVDNTIGDTEYDAFITKDCAITIGVNNADYGTATLDPAAGTYKSGKEFTATATPKTGYKFVKWSDGSTKNPYTFTLADDLDLKAEFEIQKFNIIFYQEDGTTKIGETTYNYNAAIEVPNAPVKEGWTFKAWDPEVPATALADGSYKATYTINKYKIKFVKDDGTTVIKEEELEYQKPITAPTAPTKEGYTFKAWNPAVDATVPAKDMTYKATYDVNKYKVHFVYKADEDNNTTKDEEWDYGTVITSDKIPSIPTISGMPFLCWKDGEGNTLEVGTTKVPAKEVTYTAQYDVQKYNITYVIGDQNEVAQVGYKTPIPPVEDPQKEGYEFTGWTWTKTAGGAAPYDDMFGKNMPDYDLTATANFTILSFTVKFFEEDGTTQIGSDITDEYGKAITAPTPAPKTGHHTTGWKIIGGDGTVLATVDKIPGANTSYQAVYEANKHKITYKVDGQVYQTVENVAYGTTLVAIAAPQEREGYTFSGWSPFETTTMPDNDIEVTGTFNINSYTIAFVTLNEDSSVKETIQSTTQEYNTDIVAPNTGNADIFAKLNREEEGWIFKGWALQEAPDVQVEVAQKVPARNLTYVAYYVPNIVNVIYIVDGDTLTKVTVDYRAVLPEDPTPEKEGYTFSGWTTWRNELATVTYESKPATMPAENVVAEGTFIVNQYKVTFISEGQIVSDAMVDFGAPIVAPTNPEKIGHEFAGWAPAVPSTVPSHNVTFYAQFEPITYTIFYSIDGEEYDRVETPYGATITPLVPEKEGYTFSGWDNLPETMPARNVRTNGTFTINQYNVTFIAGEKTVQEEMLDYGAAIVAPEAPVVDGYKFVGWEDLLETVPAYDVTFEAIYEEVEIIEPVEEETKVDFSEDLVDEAGEAIELDNTVVNNTYYNFDSSKGDKYDTEEKCLVLSSSTSDDQMEEVVGSELGSSTMAENFAGLIISVKGEGSLEIDCQTIGAKELFVKVGDNEPEVFKKNERGLAEITYKADDNTPVYIYASSSTGTETEEDALKIWSVNIVPGPVTPVAIKALREAIEKGGCYTIDGRKLNDVPTKKGMYIINGKKVMIK